MFKDTLAHKGHLVNSSKDSNANTNNWNDSWFPTKMIHTLRGKIVSYAGLFVFATILVTN